MGIRHFEIAPGAGQCEQMQVQDSVFTFIFGGAGWQVSMACITNTTASHGRVWMAGDGLKIINTLTQAINKHTETRQYTFFIHLILKK